MPIQLESVSYLYPSNAGMDIPALRDVSLKIGDGEFVGVMGHTGCGKTTLLQLMAGLFAPTSGKVLLDGKNIHAKGYDKSELRKSVSLVFQFPEYQLFESTVEKDVAFGLKHSGLSRDEIAARVKWALEVVAFSYEKIRLQSPLSLSGGEKRRVAIAGALASKPRFLLFDEPVAGVDSTSRHSFLEMASRLNGEGTTLVMVSHNADALGEYAKRLLVFHGGTLAMDGATQEVFADVEGLQALHLNPGTPRSLGHMLSRRGIPIPQTATSYSELLCALKSWMVKGPLP